MQQAQQSRVSSKYEQLEQIGQGQFGIVKKIRRISDNRIMVWKEINFATMSSEQKKQLVCEVNILKQLSHPHIIKYYDRVIDKKESKIYIIMEFCAGGDLGVYLNDLKKRKELLDEDIIWKILFQTILALEHCHNREKKVLHRDIKPANILIDETGANIKLGDFGLSRELGEHSEFAKTYVGTPYYMSPQQYSERPKYNEKSDIWSVGCIIYEMAALKRPFVGQNHFELGANIKNGKLERIPMKYSEQLMKIISWMLTVNPERRPTATQLLTVPYLKIRNEDKEMKMQIQKLRRKEKQLKSREEILLLKREELRMEKSKMMGCGPKSLLSRELELEQNLSGQILNSVRMNY